MPVKTIAKPRTFTPGDFSRRPKVVLAAVLENGSADMRFPNGETLVFKLKPAPKTRPIRKGFPDFDAHWQELRALGLIPPPPAENERINKIIAGEI